MYKSTLGLYCPMQHYNVHRYSIIGECRVQGGNPDLVCSDVQQLCPMTGDVRKHNCMVDVKEWIGLTSMA